MYHLMCKDSTSSCRRTAVAGTVWLFFKQQQLTGAAVSLLAEFSKSAALFCKQWLLLDPAGATFYEGKVIHSRRQPVDNSFE